MQTNRISSGKDGLSDKTVRWWFDGEVSWCLLKIAGDSYSAYIGKNGVEALLFTLNFMKIDHKLSFAPPSKISKMKKLILCKLNNT